MTNLTRSAAIGSLIALGLALAPRMNADTWDQLTTVTFSAPVEIPGQVLLAGTYVFKLLDSPSDRSIVQIFNKDQTKLFATVLHASLCQHKRASTTRRVRCKAG